MRGLPDLMASSLSKDIAYASGKIFTRIRPISSYVKLLTANRQTDKHTKTNAGRYIISLAEIRYDVCAEMYEKRK